MLAKIKILKKGVLMSIQDKGRSKHASIGVPRAGHVDTKEAVKLNTLLGNKKSAAVLEWSMLGPRLKFPKPTYIAISQHTIVSTLNGAKIRTREKIFVPADSVLKLGTSREKMYQYVAIKYGFKTKSVLSSQSHLVEYLDSENMDLKYAPIKEDAFNLSRPSFQLPSLGSNNLVRSIEALPGPEFDLLPKSILDALSNYFTLSNRRDRMGIQFNELVANDLPSMLSVPIIPGTIQLTPGGKMILLGKDCQTTGGYPRILWLPEDALAKLYQLPAGVKFKLKISNQ